MRKEKDLSQDDLVVVCNMDRSYLAEIEEGKVNPSLKVICKIAKGLNIKLYEFFINI